MKRNRVLRELGLGALLTALAAGCTGINASKSVAPIDFLLPGGFIQNAPTESVPLERPDNAPVAATVAQVLP